jgi:hypothetical protein
MLRESQPTLSANRCRAALPESADCARDPVPAAPADAGGCHPPGDRPQVGPILRGYPGRVEAVCQLLEALYPAYSHDRDQVPVDGLHHGLVSHEADEDRLRDL